MEATVADIASVVGGEIEGPSDTVVRGIAAVSEAMPGDIVLGADDRFFAQAAKSAAICIVAAADAGPAPSGKSVIRVARPVEAFARILEYFAGEEPVPECGIGPGAVVEDSAVLGRDVAIGARCCVGRHSVIGDGCVLFPNVTVGDNVRIGEGSKLYPGVVVYHDCEIGRRVILHAGAVIGADGFGYITGEAGHVKIPHMGTVKLGDDVEIGANSTVDRAKTGATVIGNGTKIDNLVHIAHNCKIGARCLIVAQSGVAGSVEIGDGVTLAAQSGVAGHVCIGDGTIVAARGGVIGDIGDNALVSGFPARDHSLEKRIQAARLHLPELIRRMKSLEQAVEKLQAAGVGGVDGDSES